ncbi:Uncharacterized protein HZ326_28781 [Fusarium oxysporum f. sp. albedinis]|nr:Uncharacterized protein HZ326_28781 [Fusarium oxysporum f. sp. albedinis]
MIYYDKTYRKEWLKNVEYDNYCVNLTVQPRPPRYLLLRGSSCCHRCKVETHINSHDNETMWTMPVVWLNFLLLSVFQQFFTAHGEPLMVTRGAEVNGYVNTVYFTNW